LIVKENFMGPKGTRHSEGIETSPIFVSVEEFPKYGVTVVKKVIRESGRLRRYLSILENDCKMELTSG
jgi:hypothetical protein